MIPDGAHTSTLQRFLLKSLPVSQILKQWAGIRDLEWKEEQSLPPKILDRLNELGWLQREGGLLLGDRKRCRAGLIYHRRNGRAVSSQEYIRDLKEHLRACGRKPDDFAIFRPGQLNLSHNVEPGSQPLFYLFWAPERPPLERLLGGREKLPFTLLAEGGPEKVEAPEPHPVTPATQASLQPFSVSEEHAGATEPEVQDIPWKDSGYCKYALLGSTRGNRSFKFFIKYGTDHLRVFLFSSNEEISNDFLGSMFDALGNHDDPVQGYLEQIRVAAPRDIHGLSLSLSDSGVLEFCGFGLSPILIRHGSRARKLPDLRDYHQKFSMDRWRVSRGRLLERDQVLLCPANMLESEMQELFSRLEQSGQRASSWLRYRGLGKALLIEARPFRI
ncbi:MAG: hypothetical protein CMF59_17540 [Leptospiraceae bacterium]|nr:hypothetical protein [Leptospiraceae bacterium]